MNIKVKKCCSKCWGNDTSLVFCENCPCHAPAEKVDIRERAKKLGHSIEWIVSHGEGRDIPQEVEDLIADVLTLTQQDFARRVEKELEKQFNGIDRVAIKIAITKLL